MNDRVGVDDLRELVEGYVFRYPSITGARNWWRKPILVTATVDDRFACLPEIAAVDHLHPRDLLADACSVIVYFLPFVPALPTKNHPGKFPCRNWGIAYNDTNLLIEQINEVLVKHLERGGHRAATTPPTANFDIRTLLSRWSHKHLAHLAGLGRFGVHCQLITPSGCCGRLGSLVTTADLGDHPLCGPEENCLHKRGEECLQCVHQCPVRALGPDSFDRHRCYKRIKAGQKHLNLSDLPSYTEVCGKCQVMLPCSLTAPGLPGEQEKSR